MNEEKDEIRFTKWLDGELDDHAAGEFLRDCPELKAERDALMAAGEELREQFPAEIEVPFADGFNRQVLRRIQEDQDESFEGRVQRFISWFTQSEWAFPAAVAACLVFVLMVGGEVLEAESAQPGISPIASRVDHSFAPNPDHRAFHGARNGLTVLEIEGLIPIPESVEVAGLFPASTEANAAFASATLYDQAEQPMVVLALNAAGEPRIRAFD